MQKSYDMSYSYNVLNLKPFDFSFQIIHFWDFINSAGLPTFWRLMFFSQIYFESVFVKPHNFYINIYNIKQSKKFMKIAFSLAPNVSRPLKLFYDFM